MPITLLTSRSGLGRVKCDLPLLHKITSNTGPTTMPSHAPPLPYQIDYPSFPPEIRNKIMEFVLVPGDIHPPYSRNGVQLLATSRQNYEDGHVMYYSDNVFHIPRGRDPRRLLDKYQQKHLQLVRRVTLAFDFLDLEGAINDKCLHKGSAYRIPRSLLKDLWILKLISMQALFPGLVEVRAKFPDLGTYPKRGLWVLFKEPGVDLFSLEVQAAISDMKRRDVSSVCVSREELGYAVNTLKQPWPWSEEVIDVIPNEPSGVLILLLSECPLVSMNVLADIYKEIHSLDGLRSWFIEQVEEERRKGIASE